ncbi:hypothetical protein [Sphingomonas morindae]|nr:hypothetical protein [Sphingomonas morindae]
MTTVRERIASRAVELAKLIRSTNPTDRERAATELERIAGVTV